MVWRAVWARSSCPSAIADGSPRVHRDVTSSGIPTPPIVGLAFRAIALTLGAWRRERHVRPFTAAPAGRPGRGGHRPGHGRHSGGSLRRQVQGQARPKAAADAADPDPVLQRLPREPRAAVRLLRAHRHRPHVRRGRQAGRHHAGRRGRGVPRLAPRASARGPRQHADRRRGRPHRRHPAALGRLPRRADDRVDEQARARRQLGGQPRVRRGLHRAPAHGRRRLHRRRRRRQQPELLPRRLVQRRELRLPRGQRRAHRDRARRSSRPTRSRTSTAPGSASSG